MSLQSQTEYYERRFTNNPQYIFTGIFSDAGISGAKENRPGFQAMLAKARAGEIDLIYTKSISRFARNTLLLLQIVRELRSVGVCIVFEEQNISTLRSEGELMLTFLAAIAEEERKSVRSNVQWALRNKCIRGEVMVDTNRLIRQGRVRKVYPFTRHLYCAYCGSVMIRVAHAGGWISWICCKYLRKGKSACVGTRIAESTLIVLTQDQPITDSVIVEEVHHEKETKKRYQKDYRFKPISNKSTEQDRKA